MELATALIWTLRIVLPIVLFCIYFKLQSPKDEPYATASKYHISRGRLLARRKVSLQGCTVPEALQTLALKDATQAPSLFAASARQMRGGGRKEERAPRERREKRDREPKAERGKSDREKNDRERDRDREKSDREAAPEAAEAPDADLGDDELPEPGEEKVHLESLLNYVAFNRKEQQRTFLPDEAGAPPPPPPPKRRPTTPGAVNSADTGPDKAAEEATKKANADAQMVLRGAINFKRADVARDLYDKLLEGSVEISERTFTLMIEASVLAKDLKSASDFLMKMETSGFCPDSEVLDKVMDLYSQQKQQKEQDKEAHRGEMQGESMSMVEEFLDGGRAKLSADARIFVPSFGIPPPPPPPGPQGPPAPMPEESAFQSQSQSQQEPARTKLKTAAKPFEPTFNYAFDSYSYNWTPGESWPEEYGIETSGKEASKLQTKGAIKGESDDKVVAKSKSKKERTKAEVDLPETSAASQEESRSNKENRGGKKPAKAWKPKQAPEPEPQPDE